MRIRYIPHDQLDRQLYNSCVHYALNGRPWGYKWYLDATARRFDALVEGEYESVMPLVSDQTWAGRKRLRTPVLTPALGVFSVHVLSQKRMGYFLREVDSRFEVLDAYGLTGEPSRQTKDVDWEWVDLRNRVLPLEGRAYDQIAEGYDSDLLRSLQRATDARLLVHANQKPERVAEFVARNVPGGDKLQHPMLRVLYNALHRGWGWTTAVTDPDGEWLAACVFVHSHGRVCAVLPAESRRGGELRALDLLFDYALRQASGREVTLDFATTDERYARFGARAERYWAASKSSKLLGVLPL